jgi:hypothetical protein
VLLLCIWCRAADGGSSYYQYLSVCSETSIDVTGVSILCDTPGVWYYGSNGYRNSKTCHKGDKATLQVTFDIIDEDFTEDSSIYFSLLVSGGDQEVTVYKNAHLCSIGILSKTSGDACPNQGSFTITTKLYFVEAETNGNENENGNGNDYGYYLGDDDGEDSSSSSSTSTAFYPFATVGFASDKNSGYYDLGGANTNLCGGQSKDIQSEIQSTVSSAMTSNAFLMFVITFGVIVGAMAALGGITFYIWENRTLDRACFPPETQNFYDLASDSIEFSDKKVQLMGQAGAMMMA